MDKLFTAKSFDADFALVCGADGMKGGVINMPDGIRREQFVQWTEQLADQQMPSWLGLPNNAEKVLLTGQGSDMIGKLLKMQLLEDDDDELAYSPTNPPSPRPGGGATSPEERRSDGRPAWMRTLNNSLHTWLQLVPKVLA